MATEKESGTVSVKYTGSRPIVMLGFSPKDVKPAKSAEELKKWERRMEEITGVKYDSGVVIKGGGQCCFHDDADLASGGMCDLA